jgi:predicted TIM-barrel fold metal-dependent hydrolase
MVEKSKLTVISGGGTRANLAEGAYDAPARIQALDEMTIDLQAISPSPILLFYWDEPPAAAYFSRLQNETIQAVVQRHPTRFVGFGSVPLQSVGEAIAIAEEAKNIASKDWKLARVSAIDRSMIPSLSPFMMRRSSWSNVVRPSR